MRYRNLAFASSGAAWGAVAWERLPPAIFCDAGVSAVFCGGAAAAAAPCVGEISLGAGAGVDDAASGGAAV